MMITAGAAPAEHDRVALEERGASRRQLAVRRGLGSVVELAELEELRAQWRAEGRTVVWTNGCFDLFHAGHAQFLDQARGLGDVLVVGLNSDESLRRLKGPHRPLTKFADRATVLASMRAVDYVLPLRDDAPCHEIGVLRPDVSCKDDTYATLPLPERDVVESYGGRMVLLPRIGDLSTTGLALRLGSGTVGASDR